MTVSAPANQASLHRVGWAKKVWDVRDARLRIDDDLQFMMLCLRLYGRDSGLLCEQNLS